MKFDNLELEICLWDWKSYNNGIGNWEWFSIEELEEIEKFISDRKNEGCEEIFICDYDSNYSIPISEGSNIYKLSDLKSNWNCVVEESKNDSGYFEIEEINTRLEDEDPFEIAKMVQYGDFNSSHDYCKIDDLGNLVSGYENDVKNDIIEILNEKIKLMI